MHKTYHDKQKEIEKVMKRVPNWLSKGYKEINSVILLKFLELKKKNDSISKQKFNMECDELIGRSKFPGDFNQMTNFGQRNHGKFFETINDQVYLWKPVAEFIHAEYEKIKKNY